MKHSNLYRLSQPSKAMGAVAKPVSSGSSWGQLALLAMLLGVLGVSMPTLTHAADDPMPKILKKVPTEFPEEATKKNIAGGSVKAKITVESDGSVSNVEVTDAKPPKMFEQSAVQALSKWKFESTGKKATFSVSLIFQED